MTLEAAPPSQAVSSWAALRRAATGLAVTAMLTALATLLWRDALDLAGGFLILGAMQWLHESSDHRNRSAIAASTAIAVLTWIGSTAALRHTPESLWRSLAFAALSSLLASQAYAAITRHR